MTWSRRGSGRSSAANSSSTDPYKGYRLKMDPTLPSSSQAVVGMDGRRVGVVKRVGAQFSGDWDQYGARFASPHAAVRGFVSQPDSK